MPMILASAEGALDTGLVTSMVGVVKSVMGLFTEYPMNIYLIGGIIVLALGIFARAKRTTK